MIERVGIVVVVRSAAAELTGVRIGAVQIVVHVLLLHVERVVDHLRLGVLVIERESRALAYVAPVHIVVNVRLIGLQALLLGLVGVEQAVQLEYDEKDDGQIGAHEQADHEVELDELVGRLVPGPQLAHLLVHVVGVQAAIVRRLRVVLVTARQVLVARVYEVLALRERPEQVAQAAVNVHVLDAHEQADEQLLDRDVAGSLEPLLHVVQIVDYLTRVAVAAEVDGLLVAHQAVTRIVECIVDVEAVGSFHLSSTADIGDCAIWL